MNIDLRRDHRVAEEVIGRIFIDFSFHDFGTDGYTKYCGMMDRYARKMMNGYGFLYTPSSPHEDAAVAVAYVEMGEIHTVINDNLLRSIPMNNLLIQPCVYDHKYTFVHFTPYDIDTPHFRIDPNDELDEFGNTEFGIAITNETMYIGVFTLNDGASCHFKGNRYNRFGKRDFIEGDVMIPPFFIDGPWMLDESMPIEYGFTVSIEE